MGRRVGKITAVKPTAFGVGALGYDEIDDLRIAVSELCHLILGNGARGTMTLEFVTDSGRVVINGLATEPGTSIDDELAQTILSRVTDEHTITDSPEGRRFRTTKEHRA